MDRRNFAFKTLPAAAALGAMALPSRLFGGGAEAARSAARNLEPESKKFGVKFAPNIYKWTNLFPVSTKGMSVSEQMDFLGELGFIAFEDNDFLSRKPEVQDTIVAATKKYGMQFGVFTMKLKGNFLLTMNIVAGSKKPDKPAALAASAAAAAEAVETARRIGAKWITVVPGQIPESRLNMDIFSNVVEHLRAMAKIFEPHGLVMVLEPLSFVPHPGWWLKTTAQAYALCKAVNSPACKILFDIYHQQIEEGNLFRNIENHFDEIAYFHIGDVPKRTEPFSGEINYTNLIRHIVKLGYNGILGMEHRLSDKSLEGERKLMRAYRALDEAARSAAS